MYIQSMHIENYRNLQNVTMHFHEQANYIVGENAIGKSGFLRLLKMLSAGWGLREEDFTVPEKPIVIILELVILQQETEQFVQRQTANRMKMRVRLVQYIDELYPRLFDDDTEEELPLSWIRRIRYISYSAMEASEREVPSTLYRELEEKLSARQERHIGTLSNEWQEYIQRESQFGTLDTSYYVDIFLLSTYLSRQDRPRADNLKFISLVALRIITEIYMMTKRKAIPFEHLLIINEQGKKYLPLIISIDEPEIHLHPYMQRSILTYYKQVLANEDERFCALLRDLFGIDGLRGQLFVVTHSTDALVDDYRNIIRLYRDTAGGVQAACGATFHFNEEIEKHLIMHFPEVKEALYSRSVLIVEGETEYGCFQLFGTTLGLPFDYYGICLINARGESSISKIKKLLEYFRIPVVALYDGDVKRSRSKEKRAYFTDEICFEMDLVKTMIDQGKRRALDHIIDTACGAHARATADMIKKACRKLELNYHDYPPRLLWNVNPRNRLALYVYYFAWLYSNKGVILGRILGRSLHAKEIPPAFVRVIEVAGQLAKVQRGK